MNKTSNKFTLKYSSEGSEDPEDYSPMDITFEIPSNATIDQMLFNFECFLKACGFVFDTNFVQSCKTECDHVPNWNDYLKEFYEKNESDCVGKELEKLQEVAKNHWVHGICNPSSQDLKK